MRTFGKTLKQLRAEKGFTQDGFADYLDIPFNTYKAYEADQRMPKSDGLLKLAKALNVSTDYLLGVDDERKPLKSSLMFNTEEENKMIRQIRTFDETVRQSIFDLVDSLYRSNEDKEDSEYYPYIQRSYFYSRPSAGKGNVIFDEKGTIRIKATKQAQDADFVVQVDGQSMEPKFKDGDFVLVKSQDDIQFGDIGVFLVNGEAFIKQKRPGYLHSLNRDYQDIEIKPTDEVRCFGKVIGKAEI